MHNNLVEFRHKSVDLQQYLKKITRYKWLILLFVFSIVGLTALVVYSLQPTYRATATLLIESKQAKIVSIEQIYGLDASNSDYYETQYEILKSRVLAEQVVSKLDLINHPEFRKTNFWSHFKPEALSRLPFKLPNDVESSFIDESEATQAAIDKFLTRLSISPIRKTQLVKITFESKDRELARDVANALADAYIDSHLDAKLQMTRKATAWLTGRMDNLKNKLSTAEKRLQDFRDKESLVNVEGLKSLAAKELQDTSTNLAAAREKRSEAENVYKQVNALDGQPPEAFESIPAVLNHKLVQELKGAKAEAERILNVFSKRYGPQHPKMLAAKSRVETAKTNIDRQIKVVVAGIEKAYEIAKENEKTLIQALEKSRKRIQELNRKEFALRELEHEVETNRKLYNTFFTRFQETSATEDLKSVNARIMDPAVLPRSPTKPRKNLMITVAAFVSLFIAIAVTLLKEGMNKALRSAEDIEMKLGVPVLGLVPFKKSLKSKHDINPVAIFANPEFSEFAEAIRTIRTSVILSSLDEENKITLVTSSVPNEGKTTVATSLAMALGQIEKVLLIDADMRRPSVGRLFDLGKDAPGLSNYITRTESVGECIHQYRNSNLFVMPAGVAPTNPLELLSSNRFASALGDLSMLYDRIIIDTGPVNLVSDPMVLSPYAQALIYVVKAGGTADSIVKSGIKRLSGVKQNIAGVVLNHYVIEKGEDVSKYGYAYEEAEQPTEDKEEQQQAVFDLVVPKFNSKS